MADIKLKIKAEELGKSIEDLAPHVEQELQESVENLAQATYASVIGQVQAMQIDPKNRQDYLRGLKYTKIDDSNFIIYLEGEWANQLESGFGAYSIKDKLLSSDKKVGAGSRAGEPWVRTSSKGKKYAAVPFEQKPFSGEASKAGDLAQSIKQMMVPNMKGKAQKLTSVIRDLDGNAIRGKAAVIDKHPNPMLQGLTKYQSVSDTGRVSSLYMVFRMVHEDSPGWQHPGHPGYNLFKQAEEYVEHELENIVNTLL